MNRRDFLRVVTGAASALALTPADRADGVEDMLSESSARTLAIEEVLAEDAARGLAAFVQQGWHVLEPGTPLEWGWHLDLICRELELVALGQTRDLLICVPPGFMKSLIGSVYWPAWWWLVEPGKRFLTLSSADPLAVRDSWKMRMVITSPWYRRLADTLARRGAVPAWGLTKDQNQKVNFWNTVLGSRQCFSTGGSVMGHRGDGYLVDDPHQLSDVLGSPEQVEAALGKAHEKVFVVLPSRVNDQRTAWRVVIQQRLHEDDVAGQMLKDPNVRHVILPMHAFEHDHPWRHPDDPRAPGELLDPVRMPEEEVRKLAAKLDKVPGQASAQLEQTPIPPSGGMFKRAWMTKRIPWDPQRPPQPYTEIGITVDATFKKSKHSAFVSFQAWGRRGWTEYHLLDEVHARMSYVETKTALRDFARKWSRASFVLVETKANGEALLDDLRAEIPALVGFNPDPYGDKVSRAQLSTGMWASGSPDGGGVWLPAPEFAPWVGDYCNELAAFPGSLNKDRVDAMSQVFLYWQEKRGSGDDEALTQAMAAVLEEGVDEW